MNFVEFVRGVGNVAVRDADRGRGGLRRRPGRAPGRDASGSTLFGMRPRYTSTIIAIATGMVIALVVTLVAIFASEQVKTAFFKLNSLNQQITELTRRERDLEKKVNTGRLVVQVDGAHGSVLSNRRSKRVASAADGDDSIVLLRRRKFVNANYPQLGLKPFAIPPDADRRLEALADKLSIVAKTTQVERHADGYVGSKPLPERRNPLRGQRDRRQTIFSKRPGDRATDDPRAQRRQREHRARAAAELRFDLGSADWAAALPRRQRAGAAVDSRRRADAAAHRQARHLRADGLRGRRTSTRTSGESRSSSCSRSRRGRERRARCWASIRAARRPVSPCSTRPARCSKPGVVPVGVGPGTPARARRRRHGRGHRARARDQRRRARGAACAGWACRSTWSTSSRPPGRARELYFREHPPRGWRRLVPTGLQLPPVPVDDYAAILIARRFLARDPA